MLKLTLLGLCFALSAAPAIADPCKAIPDRGPLPAYLHPGAVFSGRVAYIGDGDSLCVAQGVLPSAWIEVRLADFYAPELHAPGGEQAKAALRSVAFGKQATCIADSQSYDRIVARCTINGQSVGDLMRASHIAEGGRGRRYR